MGLAGYNRKVSQGISVYRGQAHIQNKGSKEMGREKREGKRKEERGEREGGGRQEGRER